MHLALLALLACGSSNESAPTAPAAVEVAPEAPAVEAVAEVPQQHLILFKAVDKPTPTPGSKAIAELGRMLYYDTRLSVTQTQSCNSCHMLANYGVDSQPTSPGARGQLGGRNSPTVYHAFGHVAQFWDGRAKDVEEQAKGPILNPVEMGMPDDGYVLKVLESIPGYQTEFAKVFPGDATPLSYDNVGKAIGAFERNLVTPSPFDDYLNGKPGAISDEAREGLDLFVSTGCTSCHNGAWLGGNSFQKLGLVVPYETADKGRAEVTGNDADLRIFKVPSLRNIAKTGPYFHDGSVTSLDEAVRLMATHQLGKELSDADVAKIVAFLDTLTGMIDKAYIAEPALPPSGPETPGPA